MRHLGTLCPVDLDTSSRILKAQWVEVQAKLYDVDWSEMEEGAKESPTLALSTFMEELIPILEKHIPL